MTIENFEKSENEAQAEARKTVNVSTHWFIYLDDPYKLMFTDQYGKLKWIRFCSAADAMKVFTPEEEDKLKQLRKYYKGDKVTLEDARGIVATVPEIKQYLNPEDIKSLESDAQEVNVEPAGALAKTESQESSVPATPEQGSKTFTVQKGSDLVIAQKLGLEPELADVFFMKLNGSFYIKVAGLQYIAGKAGYQRIEVTDKYNDKTQTWEAEAKIYPKLGVRTIEAIGKLIPELQKQVFDEVTKPTNGLGTANIKNVRMGTMQSFLREMAQTRAIGRALRSYTGYGATTYEELPEGEIEKN